MTKKTSTWKIVVIVLAVMIFIFLLGGRTRMGPNPQTPDDIQPYMKSNIAYGGHNKQVFDFYSAGEYSDVLVVVVHGGGWVAGDKNHISSVAWFLYENDYSVANMNYRLAPNAKAEDQLSDIASVINYIDANKKKFKLKDNYKVVLVGHSAGAHLSALYGLTEKDYGMKDIAGVVGLAGPYDLTIENEKLWVNLVMESIFGEMTRIEASPVSHVNVGESTKFLLALGTEDHLLSFEQMDVFNNELKDKGVFVKSLYVEGRTHNSLFEMIDECEVVGGEILGFLKGI